MTFVSGVKLLRTALLDHHHLPAWFTGFVIRAGILATFSVVFLVARVWLMQGGPDIFNRYIYGQSLAQPAMPALCKLLFKINKGANGRDYYMYMYMYMYMYVIVLTC